MNKEADFYDSPHLAEHYDLVCAEISDLDKDIQLYWQQFEKIRHSRGDLSSLGQLVVVDIGTGSGRVLRGLGKCAQKEGIDLANTQFIGVDISRHMIDRAQTNTNMPYVGTLSWVQACALELSEMPAFTDGLKVDFLIMAGRSFSHLYEPGQPKRFFRQVAKLLRGGTGIACISVLSSMTPEHCEGTTPRLFNHPGHQKPTVSQHHISKISRGK